jgi:starch-binding outer membrane protein, SusD/RagB family
MKQTIPARLLFLFILFSACISCKKLLEVDPPGELVTGEIIFSNDSLARAAVTGIYIKMMQNPGFLFNGGLSIFASMSADEINSLSSSRDEQQFGNNNLTPDNAVVTNSFWQHAYGVIYQANTALEQLSNTSSISLSLRKQLTGELKFIRGYSYYHLVNLFGEVPLLTTSKLEDNIKPGRAAVVEVNAQLRKDFMEAWIDLTVDSANTIPTRLAAASMLARVYMSLKNWQQAETTASAVIDIGKYSLTPDLMNTFLRESSETILQFAPVTSSNSTAEGLRFVPATYTSPPTYTLTDALIAAFETGDRRKIAWTGNFSINDEIFYFPFKYKTKNSISSPTEYNVVIRLAELYLVRAEARVHQGKFDEAAADINIVRKRAGLGLVPAGLSQGEMLSVIEQERRVELFTECGHRWIDLNRTNRAHDVLSTAKGHKWQITDHLYPIPQSEIKQNPNLSQNPGY